MSGLVVLKEPQPVFSLVEGELSEVLYEYHSAERAGYVHQGHDIRHEHEEVVQDPLRSYQFSLLYISTFL